MPSITELLSHSSMEVRARLSLAPTVLQPSKVHSAGKLVCVPVPCLGFNWPTGSQEGDSGTFSAASASIFPYVNQSNPLAIDPNAYVFLATGLDGTPLLTDPSGNALALLEQFTDGRQYLSLTFDSNAYMTHNLVLSYGLVNWVTKGLFVGEKHIYFTAQEDDWGI